METGEMNYYASQNSHDAVADAEMDFYNVNNVPMDKTTEGWENHCVQVREGQVQISLARRVPPLTDDDLIDFCDWLDQRKLPVILPGYKYVLKTGAAVDLSDNRVGPRGIEKVLTVLRKHGIPCSVLKAYRCILDDTVIDPFVEYIHTQPSNAPLSGLHISHNRISSAGAMRLVRAIVECGHYPTRVNRRPFWLRLELNEIERPEDILQTAKSIRNRLRPEVKFTMCLMSPGLCSDPKCDHGNVSIQAPYFLNQNRRGFFEDRDRVMVEVASYASYDQAFVQQSAYDQRSSGQVYRQNLAAASGTQGPYSNQPPRPSVHMQFLEVNLDDVCSSLGFSLQCTDGQLPIVRTVEGGSEAAIAGLRHGMQLRRSNGVDMSMLTESQIEEMMRQRPLSLRFGFA